MLKIPTVFVPVLDFSLHPMANNNKTQWKQTANNLTQKQMVSMQSTFRQIFFLVFLARQPKAIEIETKKKLKFKMKWKRVRFRCDEWICQWVHRASMFVNSGEWKQWKYAIYSKWMFKWMPFSREFRFKWMKIFSQQFNEFIFFFPTVATKINACTEIKYL